MTEPTLEANLPPLATMPRIPAVPRFTANDLFHWARLLWPVILVLFAGFVFFADAVVATIVSTPHPALVYAIFGVCVVAIGAAMLALHQYLYEANLARHWLKLSDEMRTIELKKGIGKSNFAPVYHLLAGQTTLSPDTRQAAVTAELDSASYSLESRLELPNFLGGALVGLGLVGTFVGLLGTLEDLSKVFSALVNSSSSTMSPTQMFSDMVSKLQAPMRGMGTAFVASLYGLLGSLIVTLMLVSARKTGSTASRQVQDVVRQLGYGAKLDEQIATAPIAQQQQEIIKALQKMQAALDETRLTLEDNAKLQNQAAITSADMMKQMSAAVMAVAEGQRKVDETIASQLHTFRDIMVNDRDNLLQLLRTTRQDNTETVKAIETCRTSFDQSARSLRAMLAYLDPVPPAQSDTTRP